MRKLTSAGVVLLALTLAACGASPQAPAEEPSASGEPSASDEALAAADESPLAAGGGLRVAYASDLDPNDIADQIGLTAAGADVQFLTEDSAVVAGLQNGNFDIGNIDITAAVKAIQAGVPLKIVYVAQNQPEFVMVSQSDITDLSQLAGRTVAYHASGSLTEILQRELVRQYDPALDAKITWTVLPESPNRAAAMLAKRIDATTLEFGDVYALQAQGDFNVLGTWADLTGTSADAIATGWVVTQDYLAANRDAVVALLTTVQAGYDTTYADEDAWLTLATKELHDLDEETLKAAYDFYTSNDMYAKSGTPPITQERWTGLDEFFRQIGEFEQPASLDMVDLDVVSEVNGA